MSGVIAGAGVGLATDWVLTRQPPVFGQIKATASGRWGHRVHIQVTASSFPSGHYTATWVLIRDPYGDLFTGAEVATAWSGMVNVGLPCTPGNRDAINSALDGWEIELVAVDQTSDTTSRRSQRARRLALSLLTARRSLLRQSSGTARPAFQRRLSRILLQRLWRSRDPN